MKKTTRAKRDRSESRLCCPECDGGLDASDLAYGLVCNACGIRVAGPFASGHEVPDYKPEQEDASDKQTTPAARAGALWGTVDALNRDLRGARSRFMQERMPESDWPAYSDAYDAAMRSSTRSA